MAEPPTAIALILASGSRYRATQLGTLGLAFEVCPADIDEAPEPEETPAATALRLAIAKAMAVAGTLPTTRRATVIGADQVAEQAGKPIGKPGSREAARVQLQAASGQQLIFHSAVAVVQNGALIGATDTATTVRFRQLDAETIARYLDREDALDCAGAFKSEALGISLCDSIESADPSALVGLPLLATCSLLRSAGFSIP